MKPMYQDNAVRPQAREWRFGSKALRMCQRAYGRKKARGLKYAVRKKVCMI